MGVIVLSIFLIWGTIGQTRANLDRMTGAGKAMKTNGAKEQKSYTLIKERIHYIILENLFSGAVLGFVIYHWLLLNGRQHRMLFYVYLGINILVNIYFWNKKTGGTVCAGFCRLLKYAWMALVLVYTLLLVYCLNERSIEIIISAVVVFVMYNGCIIGFDYMY